MPTIEIWSCETGKRISVLPFEKTGVEIRFLEFASPDRLISSARVFSDQRVQVWDVTASKLIREFEVDEFESKLAAISDDGNFLAIATSSAILVYDVRKGKKWVARAVPPETDEPLFGFDGLRFSPDGQEIAAVAQRGSRIFCWNGKTELVYDERINADLKATWTGAFVYEGPPLEWDPSGRGWL